MQTEPSFPVPVRMTSAVQSVASNAFDGPGPPKCNVLIVVDDLQAQLAIRELLDAPDRNIVLAQSGKEALENCRQTEFAAILMDVELPDLDGFATARLMRERARVRHTSIIFLTGADQNPDSSIRGYQAGAVDYLVKPVAPAVLKSKVSAFIDLYRYNAALNREIARRKAIEKDLTQTGDRMRAVAASIEAAREDERTLVSREVHDGLGQALTGLKMDLSWLEKLLPEKTPELSARLKAMLLVIDASVVSVRRISSALRPRVLDEVGLIVALKWQAGEFQLRTGIRCKLDVPAEEPTLNGAQSTVAFRTLQEALANVARHAGATRVDIGLSVQSDHFTLKVSDNGRGALTEQLRDPKSLGLLGIRERALLLGGNIQVEGKRGKGTTVTLTVPYRPAATP